MTSCKALDISSRLGHLEPGKADLINVEHTSVRHTLKPKQGMITWQQAQTLQTLQWSQ